MEKGINETLLEKLDIRVDEIGKKYENPTEKDIRRPQSFGDVGGDRKVEDDRRREGEMKVDRKKVEDFDRKIEGGRFGDRREVEDFRREGQKKRRWKIW